MDKKYTLVYSINNEPNPKTVYVNLTNACTNSCVFCLREQKDDVCGAEMWHDGNYTLEDVIEQFKGYNPVPQNVVFCGYGERGVQSPKDRVLDCDGGNCLDSKIFEIYRKLQKPNTYNYNIVLFDGDAYSSGYRGQKRDGFRAFDFSNCTIISDRENERYISKWVTKAKVIYTKQYTKELLTNIQNTLTRAFR